MQKGEKNAACKECSVQRWTLRGTSTRAPVCLGNVVGLIMGTGNHYGPPFPRLVSPVENLSAATARKAAEDVPQMYESSMHVSSSVCYCVGDYEARIQS